MLVINKIRKVHRKTPVLVSILINMQASHLESESLIKKETTTQTFSYEVFRIPFLQNSCNFNIVLVRISTCYSLFSNPRFLSKNSVNSVDLVSLESDCQVGNGFILFL